MQISLKSLEGLANKYDSARKRVAKIKEETQETVMTVVRTVEVAGAGFAFGVANGRYASPEVVGVPVDLGAAIVLHGLGFFLDRDVGVHLHNVGDGALTSYTTALGFGVGKRWAAERGDGGAIAET